MSRIKVWSRQGQMAGFIALAKHYPKFRWRLLIGGRRWGLVLFRGAYDPSYSGESEGR